ncbi:MBL fold metallo-hydrolase [Parafrankia sp. EUN1f]|uniref:MBL fold metallo-hydrolase n=1 Tax=Parafrankia sp. EUN1f TaxID=102897 RepID=UPI0001C43DE3|nr:MBL fold metallo-hydrolase [Parafrankia sp. EUN1f]EFC85745.1 beta-lactamase domain protein [Parafrankia sp. EUN1f]
MSRSTNGTESRSTWTAEPAGIAAGGWAAVRCCAALLATAPRLIAPRRPDQRLLTSLSVVDPPAARRTVRVRSLVHRVRQVPAPVVVEGQFRPATVASAMVTFLVEHPDATFLVDPALCAGTQARVLRGMAAPTRRLLAAGGDGPGVVEVLQAADVDPASIDFAVATHVHWDHVSGMIDLPGVPLWASAEERPAPPGTALRARGGSIASLYDAIRPEPFELAGPPVLTFPRSHDLFGDGSVLAVDLAGHTPGSVGLLLATEGGRALLVGDAAWSAVQIRRLRQKAPFPGWLVDGDRDQAFRTLHRLHAMPSTVVPVPAHDPSAAQTAVAAGIFS